MRLRLLGLEHEAWGVFSLMLGRLFSHRRHSFLSWWILFSLTELTDLTELFNQRFELTEGLRHTDITERLS